MNEPKERMFISLVKILYRGKRKKLSEMILLARWKLSWMERKSNVLCAHTKQ